MNNLRNEYPTETGQLSDLAQTHLAQTLNACVRWRYEDLTQLLAAQLEVLKKADLTDYAQEESLS